MNWVEIFKAMFNTVTIATKRYSSPFIIAVFRFVLLPNKFFVNALVIIVCMMNNPVLI